MDIKDLIIFLIIFLLILWLQNNDDKKFNKTTRITIYDKIKLHLFVAVCVLLIKNLNTCIIEIKSLFIIPDQILPDIDLNKNLNNDFNNNFNNNFKNNYTGLFNDIYTEPPDF
jgi:hypothetical protein